jgi:hypothetical protein
MTNKRDARQNKTATLGSTRRKERRRERRENTKERSRTPPSHNMTRGNCNNDAGGPTARKSRKRKREGGEKEEDKGGRKVEGI